MEKEKLTLWELLIKGIKKFAGEIIGAFLLACFLMACFLMAFPGFRSLVKDYVFPAQIEPR